MKLMKKLLKILATKKATSDMGTKFILAAIGLVIAIAMIPIIVASVNSVIPNLSGASLILIGLVTFIFIAGIIVVMVKTFFK